MSIFHQFTNKYSLSKTLRFELKPIGETRKFLMAHDVLIKDEEIQRSYEVLKGVMDEIHERFINDSLNSQRAKIIPFQEGIEIYKNEKQGEEKGDMENAKKKVNDRLRGELALCFDITAEQWKEAIGKSDKGKEILSGKGYKILTESGILEFIRMYADDLTTDMLNTERILDALKVFDGFFTYFTGFNQNRENYYETKTEKKTAIATRIVHENLPKFADNIITFEKARDQYLGLYSALENKKKQIKDGASGEMINTYPVTEDYFLSSYYIECLSQKGIEEYNRIIGHYNSLINLYNQEQGDKIKKLSGFKTLYKQIGCGKRAALFFQITHDSARDTISRKEKDPDTLSVEEVLHLVQTAGNKYFAIKGQDEARIDTVREFIAHLRNQEDWSGYYWSKAGFNTLSSWYFSDWQRLAEELVKLKVFEKSEKTKEQETGEKAKIPEAVSLKKIFTALDTTIVNWREDFFRERILENKGWKDESDKIDQEKKDIFDRARTPSEVIVEFLCLDIEREISAWENEASTILSLEEYHREKSKELIKNWMDHTINIFRMVKYFSVPEAKIKDEVMDAQLAEALKTLLSAEDANWYQWYDGLRNYLTKKIGEDEKKNKLKLNFDSGTLLGGWSDGQEKIKKAVLLKKDNDYYLGVLKKNNLFDTNNEDNPIYSEASTGSGRLILANLAFKTLAGKGFVSEFQEKYSDMGKRDPLLAIQSLQKIIKERYVVKYPLLGEFCTGVFTDKKEFDRKIVERLVDCYVCEFTSIDWKKVEENVAIGNLYLFRIHSKDSTKKLSQGRDLQIMYWEALFTKDSPFQLNGGGEIFYRKPAIKDSDKKIKEGYEDKPYIIEKKRFTEEKFLFHCPIKINYASKSYSDPKYAIPEINKYINDCISRTDSGDISHLGIDRGEKHLAYYSLIDSEGNIIKQGSLNAPNGQNYNEKLENIATARDEARKNWQNIGIIKEMKEGYISQLVHQIVQLAIQNNALIVLEDLNTGFKRGRQKIEKSIYQKFELALAKKLNFVVDKSANPGEVLSVTGALQLTPPISNYGDIEARKQIGIMLYTRANYTSQTDPLTGWRRSLYLKYNSQNPLQAIIDNFQSIERGDGQYAFITKPDIKTGISWKLTSKVDRYFSKKNSHGNWEAVALHCTKILDDIFSGIDGTSLLEQLSEGNIKKVFDKKTAAEGLIFTINMIMQIRNSDGKEGINNDFLHSPVISQINKDGIETSYSQFDSRVFWKEINGDELVSNSVSSPVSGDANGAYNIARKGTIMTEHIRANTDPKDTDLFVSDEEWDLWLTDRGKWKEMLPIFSSRKAMKQYRAKKS